MTSMRQANEILLAAAESVIGLYKTECVRHDGPFRSVDDLELVTLSWVHWFNTNRLHSALHSRFGAAAAGRLHQPGQHIRTNAVNGIPDQVGT